MELFGRRWTWINTRALLSIQWSEGPADHISLLVAFGALEVIEVTRLTPVARLARSLDHTSRLSDATMI